MGEATGELLSESRLAGAKRRSWIADLLLRLVKEKPLGLAGGVMVLLLLVVGIFAPMIAPYGVNEIHMMDRLSPPSGVYILGTDDVGRDVLTRVVYGARVSMVVGLSASAIALLVNIVMGGISGFIGGKLDLIVQRFVDTWMCFPGIFILLTVMTIVKPSLTTVIVILGIMYGITGSRVVRGAVIGIKENVYIDAARAIGVPKLRVLVRHVVPNIMGPLIVIFTVSIGGMILVEATLSFLGYGVPPPIPSWGGMLSGSSRTYLLQAPWMAFWPGLALALVVWGINMLGDALRDILDPRLRGGLGRYSVAMAKRRKRLSKTL